ncbi:MAG TPA: hypothetical protein VFP31_07495 [Gaiellaceae bacterium]|nr:hypothetical protein [Gaiellaceae bacterium]
MSPTVVVDGRNVQRSRWPNIPDRQLVELAREWAQRNGHDVLLVFDGAAPEEADDVVGTGRESADDWIAREAIQHEPYWLVTSDRELRGRAGADAERVIGGGSFAGELGR